MPRPPYPASSPTQRRQSHPHGRAPRAAVPPPHPRRPRVRIPLLRPVDRPPLLPRRELVEHVAPRADDDHPVGVEVRGQLARPVPLRGLHLRADVPCSHDRRKVPRIFPPSKEKSGIVRNQKGRMAQVTTSLGFDPSKHFSTIAPVADEGEPQKVVPVSLELSPRARDVVTSLKQQFG